MSRILVFGTFDILHPGHLDFLHRAKELGDFLIVSLARDINVKKIKGQKPRHSEADRKRLVESLKIVNKAVFGSRNDYIKHIVSQKPDVIALGYDQRAFTQDLKFKLSKAGLKKVKIVRLKPYKSHLYKSSKYRPQPPSPGVGRDRGRGRL